MIKAMKDEKAKVRNDRVQWRPALCGWQVTGRRFISREKVTFCFNHPRNPDADAKSRGGGSSKDFEIRGIIEKEPRPIGRTSYQADRRGYLPEVKNRSSE
jgi:hypothetical protein